MKCQFWPRLAHISTLTHEIRISSPTSRMLVDQRHRFEVKQGKYKLLFLLWGYITLNSQTPGTLHLGFLTSLNLLGLHELRVSFRNTNRVLGDLERTIWDLVILPTCQSKVFHQRVPELLVSTNEQGKNLSESLMGFKIPINKNHECDTNSYHFGVSLCLSLRQLNWACCPHHP